MSSHEENGSAYENDETIDVANQLFRTFLKDFSLSDSDVLRRKAALLALPIDLKEAIHKKVDDVVLFPFGSFYHGVGFQDDPLTAFVATGSWLERLNGRKVPKFEEKENVDDGDDTSSTGSIHSSDESDEEDTPSMDTGADGRLRQTLLLEINDTLIKRENELSGTYKHVTLTKRGKLYFLHHQNFRFWSRSDDVSEDSKNSDLRCYLEAKSFLPVQTARLIKFYCVLEQTFWPFCQFVLNWARNNGVLDIVGQADSDGLKQEHLISLVIFFLVRRQIIPSFKQLQTWFEWNAPESQLMFVDGIQVGFCEDVEIVRENCKKLGIGSAGSDECSLERLLQLLCEFFGEMSSFNFTDRGISPSTGTSFSKFAHGLLNNPGHTNNKRRLDTNSLLCLQDILDQWQNVTKKLEEIWLFKFRSRCKDAYDKLFPMIWNGEVLNGTLSVFDVESRFGDMENQDCEMTGLKDKCGPIMKTGQLKRCIRFRVNPHFLLLLERCNELAGGRDKDFFRQAVAMLFRKFVEEFNQIFWKKMVGAHLLQYSVGGDPMQFGFVNSINWEPFKMSLKDKADYLMKSLMNLLDATSGDQAAYLDGIVRFYVKNDWTMKSDSVLGGDMKSKSQVQLLAQSLVKGTYYPKVAYGQRVGDPKQQEVMAAVELDIIYEEEKRLYVSTFVKSNETLTKEEGRLPQQYLDWYKGLIKEFLNERFIKWIGPQEMRYLKEKLNEDFKKKPLSDVASLKSSLTSLVPRMGTSKPGSTNCSNSSSDAKKSTKRGGGGKQILHLDPKVKDALMKRKAVSASINKSLPLPIPPPNLFANRVLLAHPGYLASATTAAAPLYMPFGNLEHGGGIIGAGRGRGRGRVREGGVLGVGIGARGRGRARFLRGLPVLKKPY